MNKDDGIGFPNPADETKKLRERTRKTINEMVADKTISVEDGMLYTKLSCDLAKREKEEMI